MKFITQTAGLLWITPQAEKQIEIAGRTCYKSEDKITDESAGIFCRKMVSSGHHAMLEHAVAAFKIVCDRGISHEIVRHRIASYAQESTRYCNYSSDKFENQITVIWPPDIDSVEKGEVFNIAVEIAERSYLQLIDLGVPPQIARNVLPTCLKTELVMTCNFREWRHFISLRASKAAHPQIASLAKEVGRILYDQSPNVFFDLNDLL